jgi:hypothetical protein
MLLFSSDVPDMACVHILGYLVNEPWAPVIYLFTNFPGIIKIKEQLWFPQFTHAAECLKDLPLPRLLHTARIILTNAWELKKGCQRKTWFPAVGEDVLQNLWACNRLIPSRQMEKTAVLWPIGAWEPRTISWQKSPTLSSRTWKLPRFSN